MATMRCKICGQETAFTPGGGICTCAVCGTAGTVPAETEETTLGMYNYGHFLRQSGEYDESMFTFASIAKDAEEAGKPDAEAWWCAALSRAAIQYSRDPVSGKWIPQCHRVCECTIAEDEYYRKALDAASDEQKAAYEAEAKVIAQLETEYAAQAEVETQSDIDRVWNSEDMENDLFYQIHRETEQKEAEAAEKKAEEAAAEKKKAKRSTLLFWAPFVAAALALGFVAAYFFYLKPLHTYNNGVQAMKSGSYEEAIEIFGGNKSFGEGDARTAECVKELYGYENVTATTTAASPWYSIEDGALSFDRTVYEGGSELVIPAVVDGELVTSIADHGFYDAEMLTAVVIPPSVTRLADNAFQNCTGLKSLTVPGTVKSIGMEAFYACNGLSDLTLEEGIEVIGDSAFAYCILLERVVIPDSVTELRQGAFSYCTALNDFTFGTGLTFLGNYAFSHCLAMESMVLPEGLTEIRESCFAKCEKLRELTVPATVQSIGTGVFSECAALEKVSFNGTRSQWDAVTVADGNECLSGASVICK